MAFPTRAWVTLLVNGGGQRGRDSVENVKLVPIAAASRAGRPAAGAVIDAGGLESGGNAVAECRVPAKHRVDHVRRVQGVVALAPTTIGRARSSRRLRDAVSWLGSRVKRRKRTRRWAWNSYSPLFGVPAGVLRPARSA